MNGNINTKRSIFVSIIPRLHDLFKINDLNERHLLVTQLIASLEVIASLFMSITLISIPMILRAIINHKMVSFYCFTDQCVIFILDKLLNITNYCLISHFNSLDFHLTRQQSVTSNKQHMQHLMLSVIIERFRDTSETPFQVFPIQNENRR